MWNIVSIAHWADVEVHGEYLVHHNVIGDMTWVSIYRGVPERCEYVAKLLQGKKMLVNRITGQRFKSVAAAIAFDKARRAI